ncbi:hypothetical protein I4U23_014895 [Adineta vaga]|nr:hypothetical protein I4U23_014895 [Adineta vaga]
MSDDQETPEVAAIQAQLGSWLDSHRQLKLDLTNPPLDFKKINNSIFNTDQNKVRISIGFTSENLTKNSSLEDFQSSFSFVALDHLPIPDLHGIPSQWDIYPQTPMSSFSEGVTFEQYDPSTQILQLNIETRFFAFYGRIPQEHYIADAGLPKGTCLQLRRDFEGSIKLRAKLHFE